MTQWQSWQVWGTSPSKRHHPGSLWKINNWLTVWMSFYCQIEKAQSHTPYPLRYALNISTFQFADEANRSGWCSQHGTALHPATPRQTWQLCKDLICRLQFEPSIRSCLMFSQPKLTQISVATSISQWITTFMADRQQLVRLGKLTSRTLTLSTGAPQGYVLFPLLFSLYPLDNFRTESIAVLQALN